MNGNAKPKLLGDNVAIVLSDKRDDAKQLHLGREQIHVGKLAKKQRAYDTTTDAKHDVLSAAIKTELERVSNLRTRRMMLDTQITELHDVAGLACSQMGIPYIPGTTGPNEIYALVPLHESEAAEKAGLPGVLTDSVGGMKFLKWAGFIGCLTLGTFGMGALVLQTSPKMLMANPVFLMLAAGLACILIGGVYMIIHPTWRRVGVTKASKPDDRSTKASLVGAGMLTALSCLIVASVDAKAIIAMSATKAMLNPNSAPSFITTFLVAMALSAAYVLGASITAFTEGYSGEASRKIKAAQDRHLADQLEDRRAHVEIQHAIEALNRIDVCEKARKRLTAEIEAVEAELEAKLDKAYGAIPDAPELPDEHKKDLSILKKRANHEGNKVDAHLLYGSGSIFSQEVGDEE